ncbi:uncharacterized protein LOC143538478 [Bidens hawaiensis]|uniref:uncharacterized protein LOC143538478 n=1 Tax=Bidens hawaiensis TaxID=980011 RepID=UPI00404A25FB
MANADVDLEFESKSESDVEQASDEESEPDPSSVETTDVDDEIVHEFITQYNSTNIQALSHDTVNYSHDLDDLRAYEAPDFNDGDTDEDMEVWNKAVPYVVRLGMYFENKDDVIFGVRSWNIECGKELYVVESKSAKRRARCNSTNPKCKTNYSRGPPCNWYVNAVKKKNDHMWQIIIWVNSHNCYGTVVGNNNISLKSRDIATRIIHNMREDIAYSVKQIRASIKDQLHVDVSYSKAWRARKEAVERIYGSWESNFRELPQYIAALQTSNPGTVVEWLHGPTGPSDCFTFKFVFWAFGPAIKTFQHCMPIISVDGTHLKGSYGGKMLIAVMKNANKYIVPIAFTIVDEETVENWKWFFTQLWVHIASHRGEKLCLISDRHKGIINALKNLRVWKENCVHRFCLRHIRSNFMQKFKVSKLKRICWIIGSTTQVRKYNHSVGIMKRMNTNAWDYLKGIKEENWTLVKDKNHRRWENLTTNISERFNNVLGGDKAYANQGHN